MWLLLPLLGCATHVDAPPAPPLTAVQSVTLDLQTAAALHKAGDPKSAMAWARAHAQFERSLEEALRDEVGDTEVARLEYDFGRVRRALEPGADPGPLVHDLSRELGTLVTALPEPVLAKR